MAIERHADDWVVLLQRLIRIPSRFEAEHAIVDEVCSYIAGLGLEPIRVPMDGAALRRLPEATPPFSEVSDRDNVVVRLPGRGRGRSLIVNCHLDINPEGDAGEWTQPPFSGHVDTATNRIFGRGSMDDKAGVAICLGLLRVICEQRLSFDGDLIFQFVLEDEITANGSLACLEAGHIADGALILDGTRPDRAIDQHAGNMEFRVSLKGRPASVSVSHLGMNAAEMMAGLLLLLRAKFHALNETRLPPWTEFPSPFQLVIHGIWADAPVFSVPIKAEARCFVTFPPPASVSSTRAFLEHEARRHAELNNYPAPPEFLWDGFAAEPVSAATDAFRALVRDTVKRHGIADLRIGPSTGTSDMRHFARRGIPCLLYGPGRGFNPHRPDEHFYLDDLPYMMRVYLDLITAWCSGGDGPAA